MPMFETITDDEAVFYREALRTAEFINFLRSSTPRTPEGNDDDYDIAVENDLMDELA